MELLHFESSQKPKECNLNFKGNLSCKYWRVVLNLAVSSSLLS